MFSYSNDIKIRIIDCNYGGIDVSGLTFLPTDIKKLYLKEISDTTPLTITM